MYQIVWKGKPVGDAEVHKEGMFYRVVCKCSLPKDGTFRVIVTDGKNMCDLGICVPNGNGPVCMAHIPCRKLCGNNFSFSLRDANKTSGLPIASNRPFVHLDKLNAARLQFTNGQSEIVIDPNQVPQDNGQNQGYQNKLVQR